MTYALRVTWSLPVDALAVLIARVIALMALAALGLSGDPFHEPFHAQERRVRLSSCQETINDMIICGCLDQAGAAGDRRKRRCKSGVSSSRARTVSSTFRV
jgi:hypothetical protein